MNFEEFFVENWKSILDAFVMNQIKQPVGYTHEGNFAVGITYQKALAGIDDRIRPGNQNFNDVKHDVMYCPNLANAELMVSYIELKTAKLNLNSRGCKRRKSRKPGGTKKCRHKRSSKLKSCLVRYQKGIGNSAFSLKVPDYMVIYQKFNLEDHIPSAIGLIDSHQLRLIFEEKRIKKTSGDLFLKINRNDFKGRFYCGASVPKVNDELHGRLAQNKEYYEKQLELANEKVLNECLTGEVHQVIDGGKEGALDGRSLTPADQDFIKSHMGKLSVKQISILSHFKVKVVEDVYNKCVRNADQSNDAGRMVYSS